MNITVSQLKSGFYCVWINGCWINASLASLEEAKRYVNAIVEAENRNQNAANRFSNIAVLYDC